MVCMPSCESPARRMTTSWMERGDGVAIAPSWDGDEEETMLTNGGFGWGSRFTLSSIAGPRAMPKSHYKCRQMAGIAHIRHSKITSACPASLRLIRLRNADFGVEGP